MTPSIASPIENPQTRELSDYEINEWKSKSSAQVISAFSFFVFLLEFLLPEQKAAKDQFLRTAWYATIIKSLPGFYRTKNFYCDDTGQVVETSVTVNNNTPIQDYVHPDDQTQRTFEMTLGFKPFTTKQKRFCNRVRTFLQLPWFLLFPFSLFFWSFFYENKKQRKINFSEPLDMPPLLSLSTSVLQNKKVL